MKQPAKSKSKVAKKSTPVAKKKAPPKGEELGGEIGRPPFTQKEMDERYKQTGLKPLKNGGSVKKAKGGGLLSGLLGGKNGAKMKYKAGGKMGKCKGGC